jgi:hypothetical protein
METYVIPGQVPGYVAVVTSTLPCPEVAVVFVFVCVKQ